MLHFKFTIDALAAHWGAKALPQRPSLFEGKGEEEMKEGEKERKGDGRKEKREGRGKWRTGILGFCTRRKRKVGTLW